MYIYIYVSTYICIYSYIYIYIHQFGWYQNIGMAIQLNTYISQNDPIANC